jgi:hypothetical protein
MERLEPAHDTPPSTSAKGKQPKNQRQTPHPQAPKVNEPPTHKAKGNGKKKGAAGIRTEHPRLGTYIVHQDQSEELEVMPYSATAYN